MQFRREAATDTVLAVAKALASSWTSLPANVQAAVRELIERYGHEIYDESVLNRASRVVKLLEDIASLSGLPPPVVELLPGSELSKCFGRHQRPAAHQILAALQQIHDATLRRSAELANRWRTRIAQISGQLDPEIANR
jgi:uncharacterized protein (UPF0147 family)